MTEEFRKSFLYAMEQREKERIERFCNDETVRALLALDRGFFDTIDQYVLIGCPTGDSMLAILENNLRESFAQADDLRRPLMFNMVYYLHNGVPSLCWGSKERVAAWIKQGGTMHYNRDTGSGTTPDATE